MPHVPTHQVVNLRTAPPRRFFLTPSDEAAFAARMEAARAAIPPDARYVVAPGQRVRARDGSWLEPGAIIRGPDALWLEPDQVAWHVLRALVQHETVLESYSHVPPEAAK